MPVIPFPSEGVLNSATFICRHIVLTIIRNLSFKVANLKMVCKYMKHLVSTYTVLPSPFHSPIFETEIYSNGSFFIWSLYSAIVHNRLFYMHF